MSDAIATRWRETVTAGPGSPPAMMTSEELSACRRWAQNRSTASDGRIVELGCFLGASTTELVKGAREGSAERKPIIVHDAFETHPSMRRWIELPFHDGDSFRPLFELFVRQHEEWIEVREGRLPEDLPVSCGSELYSEPDPISLLFIDLAKTEGVSRTVINAYAPRLEAGAIVLHQELQYCLYPWLGLHFSQVAHAFEAVEDVPGWMTVLRCVRQLTPQELPELHHLKRMDIAGANSEWVRAIEWWESQPFPGIASHFELQRIEHLRLMGDVDASVRATERALFKPHCQLLENFNALIWTVSAQEQRSHKLGALRSALEARRHDLADTPPEITHDVVWRAVASRCAAEGYRRVALAGGGSFCRRLLESGWPHRDLEIACVIDECPKPIEGIDVLTCDEAPGSLDAIVLCSTHVEPALERMVRSSSKFNDTPIVRVYSPSSFE